MPALFDLLSHRINDATIQQISDQIGTDAPRTQRAVSAAVPLLIGALAREATQSEPGAQALDEALKRDHDGSLLDNLGDVLHLAARGSSLGAAASGMPGGLSIDHRAVDGSGIVEHLFGNKTDAVALGISRAGDLDVQKVRQLLNVLAPIVMSALGKVKGEQRLDAQGLAALLKNEQHNLEQHTPEAGSTGLLGILDSNDDGKVMDDVMRIAGSLGKTFLSKKSFSGPGRS